MTARAPLRVLPRPPRSLRVNRTISTNRITGTLRDMLPIAMGPIMNADMALDIAITVVMDRDTGVGVAAEPIRVRYRNSSAEGQFLSNSAFTKWSTVFRSQAFRRGSL